MPQVFAVVAAEIVTAVVGIEGAAILGAAGVSFLTSVVATGLAIGTARLLQGATSGSGGGGTRQDPGVRIQLPPATANKIPVVYGTAYTKGTVTDARISDDNQQMTYVLALSEQTTGSTFSIGEVYWNDQKLVFDTASGNEHIVKSSIDQNGKGDTNTNLDGLIKVRVYQGNANTATNQIFPGVNKVSALSVIGESDTNYRMDGVVYAVVQLTYSSEKGVTNLAQMTFQVNNQTLSNPGDVWYDYMTNATYGAGIPTTQVDITSSKDQTTTTSLWYVSNDVPANQFSNEGAVFSGSISVAFQSTLTVTSVSSGTITIGAQLQGDNLQYVYDNGYDYPTIVSQLSGTTGGAGTYQITDVPLPIPAPSYSPYIIGGPFQSYNTSTQKRYVINGVLSTGDSVKNNIDRISQSSAAWTTYDFVTGQWKVIPNRQLTTAELASCLTFNDDNIMGDITLNATNLEDLYNSLEVEYPSKEIRDQNDYYRVNIANSYRNDLEPDNTLSMRLDLVNNAIHASRVGNIELLQSRSDLVITFRTDYSGLQVEAGDVIKVTNDVYGFTDKLFRVTRTKEIENDDASLQAEITALEYTSSVYTGVAANDNDPAQASGIPSFGSPVSLPAPSAPTLSASNPTSNTPNFTISTIIGAGSSTVDTVEWWYSSSAGGTYSYLTNEHGSFAAGVTVNDIIYNLGAGTWYFKARTLNGVNASAYSSASTGFSWNPQPGGVSNGTISTSTFSSQVQITNTTTGALTIPLVATTSGYQPIYADSELTYDASANVLSVGGLNVSTGTVVQKVVSSGGFPLNSAGTASIYLSAGNSPAMVVSNYSGGMNPSIQIRGWGQNRAGGTGSTIPNTAVAIESALGTNASPTAMTANSNLGGISVGGYDGNNWPADNSLSYNFLGWYATENMTYSGTATYQAGSGFSIFTQPAWTRPGINATRQRLLFTSWTTSTTGPSTNNILIGSGIDSTGSAPTMTMVDGTTYTGYGRASTTFVNSYVNQMGVVGQDTAPDNATLTATNIVTIIGNRRSGANGRRNAIVSGDYLGGVNFNGQSATSSTGVGVTGASIVAVALENFSGGTTRGTGVFIATANTGTNQLPTTRLYLTDRTNNHSSDQHQFRDKTGSFTALTITTATTTVNGTLNAPGTYHCEVARSSNTATSTSTDAIVYWNKTNSDPFNWLTNFTQIKPTVAGYYLVQGQIHFVEGVGTGQINAQMRKNGSTFAIAQDLQPTTVGAGRTLNMVGVVQLNGTTDYIDASTYSSSSNGQTITGTADGAWTKLVVTKLQ